METKPPGSETTPAIALLTATITVFLMLLVYAFTATTGPGLHDSAELALRSFQLGATHATGAPLYTLAGHLLTYVTPDPALATTWLSVASATLTVGVVTWLTAQWTARPFLAMATGLSFGLIGPVWGNAVITELYAPSLLLVAVALAFAWHWDAAGANGFPRGMTVTLALALGVHFANVLLLPAFALLVLTATRRVTSAVMFVACMVMAIAGVALANYALARHVLPFSEYLPVTPQGLWLYMTGAEHQARVGGGSDFFLHRLAEHTLLIGRQYAYVGLLVVPFGCVALFRDMPRLASCITLLAATWFVYFTFFGSGDYFVMVGPVYLVLSLSLAMGVNEIASRWERIRPVSGALPLLLAMLLFFSQWPERRTAAVSTAVTDYIEESFSVWPANALVIARWNEFTVLRYAQVVEGRRHDVELMLPARTPRHYHYGTVHDFLEQAGEAVCWRPVITNKLTPEMAANFRVADLDGTRRWKRLLPRSGTCTEG